MSRPGVLEPWAPPLRWHSDLGASRTSVELTDAEMAPLQFYIPNDASQQVAAGIMRREVDGWIVGAQRKGLRLHSKPKLTVADPLDAAYHGTHKRCLVTASFVRVAPEYVPLDKILMVKDGLVQLGYDPGLMHGPMPAHMDSMGTGSPLHEASPAIGDMLMSETPEWDPETPGATSEVEVVGVAAEDLPLTVEASQPDKAVEAVLAS